MLCQIKRTGHLWRTLRRSICGHYLLVLLLNERKSWKTSGKSTSCTAALRAKSAEQELQSYSLLRCRRVFYGSIKLSKAASASRQPTADGRHETHGANRLKRETVYTVLGILQSCTC